LSAASTSFGRPRASSFMKAAKKSSIMVRPIFCVSCPRATWLPPRCTVSVWFASSKLVLSCASFWFRIRHRKLDFGIHSEIAPDTGVEPSASAYRRSYGNASAGRRKTVSRCSGLSPLTG
jgi:hypothetical protein